VNLVPYRNPQREEDGRRRANTPSCIASISARVGILKALADEAQMLRSRSGPAVELYEGDRALGEFALAYNTCNISATRSVVHTPSTNRSAETSCMLPTSPASFMSQISWISRRELCSTQLTTGHMDPTSSLKVTTVVISLRLPLTCKIRLCLFGLGKKTGRHSRAASRNRTCGPVSRHTRRDIPSDNHCNGSRRPRSRCKCSTSVQTRQ
jgi:hypothetical protein